MDPPVPNYGRPGRGPVLAEGMALAIEPMLVLGRPADPAARRRLDGGHRGRHLAAHFEHTVAITADGPWVLTAEDGGASRAGRAGAGRHGPAAGPPSRRAVPAARSSS